MFGTSFFHLEMRSSIPHSCLLHEARASQRLVLHKDWSQGETAILALSTAQ